MKCKFEKIGFKEISPFKTTLAFLIRAEDAEQFKDIKQGSEADYEITVRKKKKSRNINNFMWELCEQLAVKTGMTQNDVYKKAVREVGPYYDVVIPVHEYDNFRDDWSSNGIGWFVEKYIEGQYKVEARAYQGSSVYDASQMKRLVDYIVDEAKFYNIETEPQEHIDSLMSRTYGV